MDVGVQDLSRSFGSVEAVGGITFSVPSGTVTTLLGPSGCGKTTTLRCLAGLTVPSGGDIRFGERLVYSAEQRINVPPEERRLGMIFQDFALWPHMRIFDNVAFGLRLRHLPKLEVERRVQSALATVHLEEYARRFPFELSGGQQQRVAVARAIVTEPELLLLDEPLSSLDTALREEMRRELLRVIESLGITAVLVTHDHVEALTMSTLIVVMHDGRIEQIGSPTDVYRRPANLFVAGFLGTANVLTGTVESIGDAYRLSGPGWSVVGQSTLPLSTWGHAIVRPASVRAVTTDGVAGPNHLDGTVMAASYHGDRWQLDVSMANGVLLRMFSAEALSSGEAVRLSFEVSDCVIIPAEPPD